MNKKLTALTRNFENKEWQERRMNVIVRDLEVREDSLKEAATQFFAKKLQAKRGVVSVTRLERETKDCTCNTGEPNAKKELMRNRRLSEGTKIYVDNVT